MQVRRFNRKKKKKSKHEHRKNSSQAAGNASTCSSDFRNTPLTMMPQPQGTDPSRAEQSRTSVLDLLTSSKIDGKQIHRSPQLAKSLPQPTLCTIIILLQQALIANGGRPSSSPRSLDMVDGKLEQGSSAAAVAAFEVDDYLAFAEHEMAQVETHSLVAQGYRDHKISNYKGKNGSRSCNWRSSSSSSSSLRVAFITKSEKEILDDGYKWRKYGKKAIKSSPNPRNYYRCLSEGCNVKKRVERHREDPSLVITTYVGVHTHHAPLPSLLL